MNEIDKMVGLSMGTKNPLRLTLILYSISTIDHCVENRNIIKRENRIEPLSTPKHWIFVLEFIVSLTKGIVYPYNVYLKFYYFDLSIFTQLLVLRCRPIETMYHCLVNQFIRQKKTLSSTIRCSDPKPPYTIVLQSY